MSEKKHIEETVESNILNSKNFDFEKFKNYVNTYDPERLGNNQVDSIIKDMLYGIGISLGDKFRFSDGYKKFMDDLKENF